MSWHLLLFIITNWSNLNQILLGICLPRGNGIKIFVKFQSGFNIMKYVHSECSYEVICLWLLTSKKFLDPYGPVYIISNKCKWNAQNNTCMKLFPWTIIGSLSKRYTTCWSIMVLLSTTIKYILSIWELLCCAEYPPQQLCAAQSWTPGRKSYFW